MIFTNRFLASSLGLFAFTGAEAGEWLPNGSQARLGFDPNRLERIAPIMQSHVDEG